MSKPKDFPLEDHQGEIPDDCDDFDVSETITLTYRDDNTQAVEQVEFEEGIRFHWWMVSQGMHSA